MEASALARKGEWEAAGALIRARLVEIEQDRACYLGILEPIDSHCTEEKHSNPNTENKR